MKKITIIAAFMALSLGAFAQFTKGSLMVGGSVGFSSDSEKTKSGSTTTTNGTLTTFSFTPQVGYFVIDNLSLGAGINLLSASDKANSGGGKQTASSSSFAPFARYYYQKLYGQLAGQFGSAKTSFESGGTTTETKYGVSGWSLLVGYAYLLNNHVAIEPQIGYGSTSRKDKGTGGVTDINSGLFIQIGLQIYLPKL